MAALEYLHTRQPPVIFRDLKPSTIMRETAGTLKLIDFGIARRLDTKRTEQTVYTMIGTPGYCPPEQYQGLADPRSDVYSLGATLHHLISGRVRAGINHLPSRP
jgi:eukaryotic-like serine/threonine-protein kinase